MVNTLSLIDFKVKGIITLPPAIQNVGGQITELPEMELIIEHDFLHTNYDIILTPMYALKNIVLRKNIVLSSSESGGSSSSSVSLPYCYVSEILSGSFKIKYSEHYYGKELRWRVLE
jgi:hypothetical protein